MGTKFYLFILIISVYFLTAGGHFYSVDNYTLYLLTESIMERKSLEIREGGVHPGKDGKTYPIYSIGQSIVQIPFYLAGKIFEENENDREASKFILSFFSCFVAALTAVFLFDFLLLFGYSSKISIISTLMFSFFTITWCYSKELFNSPLAGLFSLLAAYYSFRDYRLRTRSNVWRVSSLISAAFLVRFEMLALFPVIFLPYFYKGLKEKNKNLIEVRSLIAAVLPLAVGLIIVAWYNWQRFGVLYAEYCFTGVPEGGVFNQTPFFYGLYIIFFSLDKSLFIYNPVLLASFAAFFYRIEKETKLFFIWCTAIIMTLVFICTRLPAHQGDWCWGPRYFTAILPFFFFMLAEVLRRAGRGMKIVILFLSIISIVPQLASVLINPFNYFLDEKGRQSGKYHLTYQVSLVPAYSVRTVKNILTKRSPVKEGFIKTWRQYRFESYDIWYIYAWYAGHNKYLLLSAVSVLLLVFLLSGKHLIRLLSSSL